MRQPPRSTGGWLLVGLIILLTAVLIGLGGMTLLLTSHLKHVSLRQNYTKAAYLAHAGYMTSVYNFRFDDGAVAGTDNCYGFGEVAVPADLGTAGKADDDVFIIGGNAADVLMANFIPGRLQTANLPGTGTRDRLDNWTVQNVNCAAASAVRIDWITVTWANPGAERVIRIDIPAGTSIWTAGGVIPPAGSGTAIDVTNTTIPANTARTGILWFSTNGTVTNASTRLPINVAFQLSDQSSVIPGDRNWSTRIGRYTPPTNLAGRSGSFTVKSQGIVRRGAFPFSVWRRFQEEYRLNDDDTTTNRQEIGNRTGDPSPLAFRPAVREITWTTP